MEVVVVEVVEIGVVVDVVVFLWSYYEGVDFVVGVECGEVVGEGGIGFVCLFYCWLVCG